ncbi:MULTISPECIES: hypothetical protein [Roseobacteraceae]|uniref:hypothetical protein n=1 Tax=Roseobacteraceae TaxID=2854170 RepID=UPI002B2712B5|nr:MULTISPECIES: hypothetical protein [Roseobacteraceae]
MTLLKPIAPMTFQQVLDWTIAEHKTDYVTPVKRCGPLHANQSLSQIPADLSDFKRRFPLDGFDPKQFKTEKAYKAWRRKVIAAIKGCSGQLMEEQARRARQDEWSSLLIALGELVGKPGEGGYPTQMLIPVRKLADLARQHGKDPKQVSQDWLGELRPNLNGNEWKSVQSALRRLDRIRDLPSIKPFLPVTPFGKPVALRLNMLPGVPAHIAKEIVSWVSVATRGEMDPVEGTYEGANSADDISFKTAALRKFVSTLSECTRITEQDRLTDLLTPENTTLVIRRWTANTQDPGQISGRTAHDYIKAIGTVMRRNDVSPDQIKQHVKNNRFLNEGKKQNKGMSPKAQKFCETLLGSKSLSLAFLSMHVQLRNKAQGAIDECTKNGRALTQSELEAVRSIGSVAALCALETRGAPIRIENALNLRIRGKGITFHLPSRMTDHATIDLPMELTKNDNEIWAPIKRGNLNGLEVIEWFKSTIHPLYPDADTSPFLFPGIETGGSLNYRTFLNWFKRETRLEGLPMTPHNFRHGLASLLIQANPGRWDLIERLLDDSVGTARRNYGWVNKRTQRSEVQKYVLDLTGLGA